MEMEPLLLLNWRNIIAKKNETLRYFLLVIWMAKLFAIETSIKRKGVLRVTGQIRDRINKVPLVVKDYSSLIVIKVSIYFMRCPKRTENVIRNIHFPRKHW